MPRTVMATPNDVSERYLIVFGRTALGATQFRLCVCTGEEWLRLYKGNGWLIVARDPDPNRPGPWEDDAA